MNNSRILKYFSNYHINNKLITKFLAVFSSLFYIFTLVIYPISASTFRPMVIMLACIICFLVYPIGKKPILRLLDLVLILSTVVVFSYFIRYGDYLLDKGGLENPLTEVICASMAIFIVLECARRTISWILSFIGLFFFLYMFWGQWIHGILGHGGYSFSYSVITLFGYNGILGLPIAVAGAYIPMFMIFGSILGVTGGADFFMNFSKAIAGGQRGGPAKIANISSAFFGTISGSAVANVATTGSITIPMMKRMGYKAEFAAAVEATSSTGGMIMPPIMAAAAFLMAEILGIPYLQVAKAAILPAILYFFTIWITIDMRSVKLGLKGIPKEEVPSLKRLLRQEGHLLIPLFILLYFLVIIKISPIKSAFYAIISELIVSLFKRENRIALHKKLFSALCDAGIAMVSIIVPCACAGVVVGAIGLTGLGINLSSAIIDFAGGIKFFVMFFSMVVAVIFGMGLPATVSYILCVSVLAPAMIGMGFLPIAAHLFIFYFCILSSITPPMCPAVFAAAAIAGSKTLSTAWISCKMAISAFVLPYIFCYRPLLLMEGGLGGIIFAVISTSLGIYSLVGSMEGRLIEVIRNRIIRFLLFVSGMLLIYLSWVTSIIGLILLLFLIGYVKFRERGSIKE